MASLMAATTERTAQPKKPMTLNEMTMASSRIMPVGWPIAPMNPIKNRRPAATKHMTPTGSMPDAILNSTVAHKGLINTTRKQ